MISEASTITGGWVKRTLIPRKCSEIGMAPRVRRDLVAIVVRVLYAILRVRVVDAAIYIASSQLKRV